MKPYWNHREKNSDTGFVHRFELQAFYCWRLHFSTFYILFLQIVLNIFLYFLNFSHLNKSVLFCIIDQVFIFRGDIIYSWYLFTLMILCFTACLPASFIVSVTTGSKLKNLLYEASMYKTSSFWCQYVRFFVRSSKFLPVRRLLLSSTIAHRQACGL